MRHSGVSRYVFPAKFHLLANLIWPIPQVAVIRPSFTANRLRPTRGCRSHSRSTLRVYHSARRAGRLRHSTLKPNLRASFRRPSSGQNIPSSGLLPLRNAKPPPSALPQAQEQRLQIRWKPVWRLDDSPCNWAFRPTRLPPNFRYKRARYLIGLGHRLLRAQRWGSSELEHGQEVGGVLFAARGDGSL